MVSIVEKRQRVSYGRGKRKCSFSKKKSKERGKMLLWCCLLTFLTTLPCVACLTVDGQKGGNVTLPCDLTTQNDLSMFLKFSSLYAYGVRQAAEFKGRVHKSGSCDLVLQGLKTTDAGQYISEIFDNGELISTNSYEVHVAYNITGRKGEELKFDLLPRDAEKVVHQTDKGTEEVWKRGQDDNQLTDTNGSLTISNFSPRDAGTYLVLNSSGGILNTVTVTGENNHSQKRLIIHTEIIYTVRVWDNSQMNLKLTFCHTCKCTFLKYFLLAMKLYVHYFTKKPRQNKLGKQEQYCRLALIHY
ncbi:hypothetical protein PO909_003903 [Leuciscus waleckii]